MRSPSDAVARLTGAIAAETAVYRLPPDADNETCGGVTSAAHEAASDDPDDRLLCPLVDAVLTGSPLGDDHVPMLWHIHGEQYLSRPTEEELRAGIEAQRREKEGAGR